MWEEFKKKKEIRDKKEKAIRDAFIVIFVIFLCMIEIWGERKRMIEFYMEYRIKRGQVINYKRLKKSAEKNWNIKW